MSKENSSDLLHCYNRGCGQTYNPENNQEDSCRHHPGEPYFHDAYKGWSCCNKKSVDFTEFLNIKGCTLAKHSNTKPPEKEKPKKSTNEADDIQEKEKKEVKIRAPIKENMKRPPLDTEMLIVTPTVAPALKSAIDGYVAKETIIYEDNSDEITIGTNCINRGCTYSYTGTGKDFNVCEHHPGVPIFHEGMKYWSCCQKKTTDFTVFMSQKGCVHGEHKFVKENNYKKAVQCRYDWHQTATNVIVSIYAKMYHYEQSTIEVNPIRLHVNLVFPTQENTKFDLDLELRGIIDAANVTAHMFGTKVEITMPKAEPGSWSTLDLPNVLKSINMNVASNDENQKIKSPESDNEFDLDDIETVSSGMRLAEIANNEKNNLD